jgi:prepilin-type N-terminal cleavage/methylation domain-containing protein
MRLATARPASRPSRGGFTLIELIVIMAIIAILAGITVGAVMKFRDIGPKRATQATLASAKKKLEQQWKAVTSDAQGLQSIPAADQAAVLAASGAASMSDPRVRPTYVRMALARAFPMSFKEVFTAGGLTTPWQPYVAYLATLGINAANAPATPGPNEAAICLVMILERGPRTTGVSAEDFSAVGFGQLDAGNGVQAKGLVDGWGSPLTFQRDFGGQQNNLQLVSAGPDKVPGTPDDIVSNQGMAQY